MEGKDISKEEEKKIAEPNEEENKEDVKEIKSSESKEETKKVLEVTNSLGDGSKLTESQVHNMLEK